jgi:hypothetical protein
LTIWPPPGGFFYARKPMADDQKSSFKFNPEISLGDIIMVITILVPVVIWGVRTESRIAVLEYEASQSKTFERDIKDALIRIENKLDQKADKKR